MASSTIPTSATVYEIAKVLNVCTFNKFIIFEQELENPTNLFHT